MAKKKKDKPSKILKKIFSAKALGQVAIAMIGGASEGIASSYIQRYQPFRQEAAVAASVGQPFCHYAITIERGENITEKLEFDGYDDQLCKDIGTKILQIAIGAPEEGLYETYPSEEGAQVESYFLKCIQLEEPHVDSEIEGCTLVTLSMSPKEPAQFMITADKVTPLIHSLFYDINSDTQTLFAKAVQSNLPGIRSIDITRQEK